MTGMSRSKNEQWRLASNADRRHPGRAAESVVYRDTVAYRWAARLWLAAWHHGPRGDVLSMSTWTALEGVTAIGAAALVVATAPAAGAAPWVAAVLAALLVVLVSRWTRARVAVQMPLWAAEGMTTSHHRQPLTGRDEPPQTELGAASGSAQ